MSPRSRAASGPGGVPERRDVYERLADELRADIASGKYQPGDRLAYPEVRAALAAAARNHDITDPELDAAEQDWDGYWAATARSNSPSPSNGTPASSPAATPCAEPTQGVA